MFVWVVYPSDSTAEPMTATGIADDEAKARNIVEGVLMIAGGHAFGMVIENGLKHDICRRTRDGYAWSPLFSQPPYVPARP